MIVDVVKKSINDMLPKGYSITGCSVDIVETDGMKIKNQRGIKLKILYQKN